MIFAENPVSKVDEVTYAINCANCNAARPAELAEAPLPRPACPHCGGTSVVINAEFTSTFSSECNFVPSITLGAPNSNLWRRWEDLNAELARLNTPIHGVMSRERIYQACDHIQSFVVSAYNFKDALKHEANLLGITRSAIEGAFNTDPRLSLLADLANLIKHSSLTKAARSGSVPAFVSHGGDGIGASEMWLPRLTILHNNQKLDALEVVNNAMQGLREAIEGWGLCP